MTKTIDQQAADNIRVLSAAMVEQAKSGHPGGAMGGADFIHILFADFLRFKPENPTWFLRDRFFLDPGHMSPMLYSAMSLIGKFSMDELKNFRQLHSPTPGHPELDRERGIENTSGPLGQGHTMAVGSAIAERFMAARFGETIAHKTITYISDGGIQEEIAQGAGRIAGHLGLHNLIMFYDANSVQLSTMVNEVTSEDTAAKYKAWGWNVTTIDGNNQDEIRNALNDAWKESEKPSLIIGKCIMGKGLVNESGAKMEGQCSTHGQPVSKAGASFSKSVENLGGNAQNPFSIFDNVEDYYRSILKQKTKAAELRDSEFELWASANIEKSSKLLQWLGGLPPEIHWDDIEIKPNIATRVASANILSHFAKNIENMIVMSADLANSDRTDGFLEHSKPIIKNDFSGAFLHAGVAELSMAAIANGIALHGGIHVACGTFFVFSDYMKPAIRLSALMELPVVYIWTHDAFRVGEDGPTHQPIEQEAQIRLMEHLKNHSGRNSMLVLRPADHQETCVAWQMALENTQSPTGLILSRQNIVSLPQDSFSKANESTKGARIIIGHEKPDYIFVASGSEVSTLVGASAILLEKGIRINVISVISEGLFRNQDETYIQNILKPGIEVFGLTAGLPVTLAGLTKDINHVFGMNGFGYSAPAEILDETLGFTPAKFADWFLSKI
ncbi:MAG: transketolase [Bacteroidales bacterium]|nr:transketolase [Bacteroidales bacterium]